MGTNTARKLDPKKYFRSRKARSLRRHWPHTVWVGPVAALYSEWRRLSRMFSRLYSRIVSIRSSHWKRSSRPWFSTNLAAPSAWNSKGVLSGRLRVTVHGPESREHEVGEVARGESVGEPEVHEVDGSVLNTVPADVMRRFGRGRAHRLAQDGRAVGAVEVAQRDVGPFEGAAQPGRSRTPGSGGRTSPSRRPRRRPASGDRARRGSRRR